MKPVRTLVLIAGEARARFLLNEGIGKGLRELSALDIADFTDVEVDHDDRPGRQSAGPGGMARHGFDPRDSADTRERARFAQHVADALDGIWYRTVAERLIVAAPPKMLGALRPRFGAGPAAALYADLAKDLVKISPRDLPRHFEDILPM